MKEEKTIKIIEMILLLLVMVVAVFSLLLFVGFEESTLHPSTVLSSQPYAFNLTACTANPTPQYCGIPNGQVCGVENNNSTNATVIVCLDYWISPNGKQVIVSNTQNVQSVLSNLP